MRDRGSPPCSAGPRRGPGRRATWSSTFSIDVWSFQRSAAGLGQDAPDLGLGGLEVGLGGDHGRLLDVDLHLVRFAIELDQQVALLHAVIVVDQDPGHLAGHPGRHERHVPVDVSVIGGDRVQRRFHRGDQEISRRPPGRPRPPPTAAIFAGGAMAPRPQGAAWQKGRRWPAVRLGGPYGHPHRLAAELSHPPFQTA